MSKYFKTKCDQCGCKLELETEVEEMVKNVEVLVICGDCEEKTCKKEKTSVI